MEQHYDSWKQKEVFFIKLWYDKGIIKLSDLLDKNGNIFTFFQLRNKYKFEYNFVEFYSVKTAIPYNWKNNIHKCLEADLTAQEEMITKYNEGNEDMSLYS